MQYKLNISRDIDSDEPGVYILNLPSGFRFDEPSSPDDRVHVRGYDSMRELRQDIKFGNVIPCDCRSCKKVA